MSLPALTLPIAPKSTTVEILPTSIVHWKLVERLFEEGRTESACKVLIKWAASHRGATEDVQYAVDGLTELRTFDANEAKITYREWYWRKAFDIFYMTTFKDVLRGKKLPQSPFISASWEREFKKLCEEINGAHPATRQTVRSLQRVSWNQRELDEWYAVCKTGTRHYHYLAAVLEFVGARTESGFVDRFWGQKDRYLTMLVNLLSENNGQDFTVEAYEQTNARIAELRAEGAELL
jgi:hypothetical protein